ncbi:hypothetical protein [Thermoleptolyngbya sp. C42_A2020_037]|uniref:hypothetical protein n=1 Tax=Thermoleptolyngbya sp. C42_A2020_037 TaxID=2747799 RepID=UPI0019E57BEC|nr:hypothetical protein [Thermoleptolyngbya sp. C42_A2020_037]MBF2083779.1 hypothetical protein [Thermoleptolyngbya sp. C42_A2020_037]
MGHRTIGQQVQVFRFSQADSQLRGRRVEQKTVERVGAAKASQTGLQSISANERVGQISEAVVLMGFLNRAF